MNRRARRALVAVAVVGVVAITASLGFVAGRVTSPAQREAMAARPSATPPTARVELRSISTATIGRGTISFANPTAVELPAKEQDVVTYAPLRRGQKVTPGDLLIELAGEPVFAMNAPFSPYRDLRAGDSGRDVEALRAGMRAMGLRVSTKRLEDGEIARLGRAFKARGYELPSRAEGCAESETGTPTAETTKPDEAKEPCKPRTVSYLPKTWWIGVSKLPGHVSEAGPSVGSKASASKNPIALSTGQPVVVAEFAKGVADPAVGGSLALEVDGGAKHTWSVASVAAMESNGQDGGPTARWVLGVNAKVDAALVSATGRLVIGSENNAPVLAVPLTAISASAASGKPAVRVVTGDTAREVEVELGQQADGWVAVAGALPEGTLVLVG